VSDDRDQYRRRAVERNRERRRRRAEEPPRRCADCGAAVESGADGAVRCWDCLERRNRGRKRLA
jgi:hypothetical protein